jgi:transposase
MFIRAVKKQRSKDAKVFYQFNLVQASRVDGKVKQRVVLYLGSDPLLQDNTNRNIVLSVLKAKIFNQQPLFPDNVPQHLLDLALSYYEKYCIKYGQLDQLPVSIPPAAQNADFHKIDIKGLEVKQVRSFGAEYLCKQVLDKLNLKTCFRNLGMNRADTNKALISIIARAVFCSSEHKTAQILEMNSELAACYNYDQPITHKQLYKTADTLFKYKEQIDTFIYERVSSMFDITDKLVIFDISNTYFETRKAGSKLAKHGRSKEKRNDCPLVVFTGVINAEGFIRHSRIYEGNMPDTETLEDMIADLSKHRGTANKQTIVIDAGIATEENLELIKSKGYDYVCVSRKRLKDYPVSTATNKVIQLTDREKNKVELSVFRHPKYDDTWMYVQSEAKRTKEQSMESKLTERFVEDIEGIKQALSKKGGTKKLESVHERIGRAKERHKRISGQYEIEVNQQNGIVLDINWKKKNNPVNSEKSNGVYFIRTSYQNPDEKQLWQIYNTIREVESTFRCLKSDLQIRPVYHQKDERIESHIYLTILAYQLVNTIRYMLKSSNIHYDWNNILRIMSTQTIQTIELPTDKKTIHLRKPAKPIKEVELIYHATKSTDTHKPIKKYVVYH